MNLIDCHNHSLFSFDAEHTVKEMCETAQKLGLYAFSITDHCDVEYYEEQNININISKSISELTALKGTLGNTKLIAGIELGQSLQDPARATELLSIKGIDFVIASLHTAKDKTDYYYLDYSQISDERLIEITKNYYFELFEMASICDFDVLGHITYPFRYISDGRIKNPKLNISVNLYDEIIYEIFKKTVQRGKGIEINTSGLRQTIGETMPGEKYIKMYNQLGGEILSIGSDAHSINFVGSGIEQAYEIAKNAGFSYVTYFENRKPVMVKI